MSLAQGEKPLQAGLPPHIKCLKNERVIYELFVNNVHNRAQKSALYSY